VSFAPLFHPSRTNVLARRAHDETQSTSTSVQREGNTLWHARQRDMRSATISTSDSNGLRPSLKSSPSTDALHQQRPIPLGGALAKTIRFKTVHARPAG
jgi:hypothetical protein